jgi:RecA-family ATPase
MRWEQFINPAEVRKAIKTLQDPGDVFEVRAIGTAKKDILSGYFRDAETLLKAFDTIDLRQRNVYITLGKVKDECFARSQSERFLKSPQTSSDTEIVSYRWLFVDLDPVRTAGISSSNAELKDAEELSHTVLQYMQDLGFEPPVIAASGNGYHLLYRIDVLNDEAGRALITKCLKVLSALFDSNKVKIDTTNSNPSRICKLHGTLAQKGTSTAERPHRMSRILSAPEKIEITDESVLQTLASELPEEPQPERRPARMIPRQKFDIKDFMAKHGITYEEDSNDRARIYKLDECPFDPSHKDGDAKIFSYSNGAIAFKCHHNSCRGYKWQDVRRKFEPDAYDRDDGRDDEEIDAGWQKHLKAKTEEKPAEEKQAEKKPKKLRKLKTAEELMQKDIPEPEVYVGVGDELPILVEGTCILSAKPKLGKSWLALSLCLAVANGENFLGYKTRKCSSLYLDLETSEALQQKRLKKALNGRTVPKNFYLETETDSLNDGFIEQIESYMQQDPDIGVVVIDVFQIIRTPSKSMKETEYEHAYRDITPLNELALKYHIAIILVCHDRKAVDPDDPFSNILGSTGLQGAATQMMVMFRKRKDDPIHISVKGKTIDGLPELNVKLENAQWEIVAGVNTAEQEKAALLKEYFESDIRKAVIAMARMYAVWKGRCNSLINEAVQYGIPITDTPKAVGGFLHRHQGRFMAEDKIKINIINNGTGGKSYEICKFTVDTVDENTLLTVDGFENPVNKRLSET